MKITCGKLKGNESNHVNGCHAEHIRRHSFREAPAYVGRISKYSYRGKKGEGGKAQRKHSGGLRLALFFFFCAQNREGTKQKASEQKPSVPARTYCYR